MPVSRRTLLKGGAVAAGAAAAWGGIEAIPGFTRRWLDALRRAADPELPEAPPGPLDTATLATLLAAARALVGDAARRPQYGELLRSRAEAVAGYRRLYRRFAARLEAEAGPGGLGNLPEGEARRIVARLAPPGRLRRLRLGLAEDERGLFRSRVVLELLGLYAATDAWIALGYDAWPGTPRGLEVYTRPAEGVPGP